MNRIEKALANADDTRAVQVGAGTLSAAGTMFRGQFPGQKAVVIADATTYGIAGRQAEASLAEAGIERQQAYVYDDPGLHAEWRYVEMLDEFLRGTDAIPVAVGAGTINDLTKLCACRAGRRYMCVATAASMDGYTAFGASVTFEGAKQTFACPAPQAVLADAAIIARAPAEMTAAGYADLFAKITAGADWILSEELGVEAVDPLSFSIVQDGLKEALADPQAVRGGGQAAIGVLTEGLILSGFGMQAARSSRPASGADHQFSHLWDMEHHTVNGAAPSHGYKVSIGMLASTALYEQLFKTDIENLDIEACVQAWPGLEAAERYARALFAGTDFPEIGVQETRAKYIPAERLREQLALLRSNWPRIRHRLQDQLVPFAEARQCLRLAGAPVDPEQIGITRERLYNSFIRAQHIRRRFTILDLAVRIGCLDRWVDAIFAPGGEWGPGK